MLALQETAASYRQLFKERPKNISAWISTPLDCVINGFDHYVNTLNQVAGVLHRSRELQGDNKQAKPDSITDV